MEALKAGREVVVAAENEEEVGLIAKPGCFVAAHLTEVCAWLEGKHDLRLSSTFFRQVCRGKVNGDFTGRKRVAAID